MVIPRKELSFCETVDKNLNIEVPADELIVFIQVEGSLDVSIQQKWRGSSSGCTVPRGFSPRHTMLLTQGYLGEPSLPLYDVFVLK